jgi:hypothetical protein
MVLSTVNSFAINKKNTTQALLPKGSRPIKTEMCGETIWIWALCPRGVTSQFEFVVTETGHRIMINNHVYLGSPASDIHVFYREV